jgi:translation initiation factor IF-2
MADVKIGKITHYYDKIGVAVIELTSDLSMGDEIKISGHDKEFTQKIGSMQVEHEGVEKAKKGQAVGVKVDKKVKEGDEVFKLSA